jgi:hypothetical protein
MKIWKPAVRFLRIKRDRITHLRRDRTKSRVYTIKNSTGCLVLIETDIPPLMLSYNDFCIHKMIMMQYRHKTAQEVVTNIVLSSFLSVL